MINRLTFRTLQAGLLVFWAIWTGLVALTNLFDLAKVAGVAPAGFTPVSGNYGFILSTTAPHGIPVAIAVALYIGVIAWQFASAGMFARAWLAVRGGAGATAPAVEQAFVVSLALWAAFLIVDEALIAYAVEATHMRILAAQIVTLVLLRSSVRADHEVAAQHAAARGVES